MNTKQDWRSARWNETNIPNLESRSKPTVAARALGWLRTLRNRAILGVLLLVGMFLFYRAVWLTSWYWPYRLLRGYFSEQLPMAAPWAVDTLALLVALLIFAQGAALLSFVLWGRGRRETLILTLAGILVHGGLSWYSHGRVAVDERGKVVIRVVESPDGKLKVIAREFDPVTGRRSRIATEADLVMLDLQRRGVKVRRLGKGGPFRTAQGTINVYYTRQDGKLALYTGPRHPEVSGEMPLATDEVIRNFLRQP